MARDGHRNSTSTYIAHYRDSGPLFSGLCIFFFSPTINMSSSQQVPAKKQQGMCSFLGANLFLPYSQLQPLAYLSSHFQFANDTLDLQTTYSNFKNTLQQIASKIGDIEQEAEEHKFVSPFHLLFFHLFPSPILVLHAAFWPPRFHLPCSRPPSIKPHCSPTYHHHTADLIII